MCLARIYLLRCFFVEKTITVLARYIELHKLSMLVVGLFGPDSFNEKAKAPLPPNCRPGGRVLAGKQGSVRSLDRKILQIRGEEIDYSNRRAVMDVLEWKLVDNSPWTIVLVTFSQDNLLQRANGRCVNSCFDWMSVRLIPL